MNQLGSNKRVLLIGVGALLTISVLGGATYALILANQSKSAPVKQTAAKEEKPATTGEMTQGLTDLNKTAAAEKEAYNRAQAARDDQAKRIILSK